MCARFISIWFPHLTTDWFSIRLPALQKTPFVFAAPDHGRMLITATNHLAQVQGADTGMAVADARALFPSLQVFDERTGLAEKLLKALAGWCVRYTPVTAIDPPNGLILDISGCAHLWGGERPYLREMITRLKSAGYHTRAAMADTIGAAWAIARFGQVTAIINSGEQEAALLPLPAAALRLPAGLPDQLQKLGLYKVGHFISMPRAALRRRFGQELLHKIDQALGRQEETIQPVQPIVAYQERLSCLEPIVNATGIEIALQKLLERLCHRLKKEEKGLRAASFKGYRVDGKLEQIIIGTSRGTYNTAHLFKLFEHKIATIEPALGIELFVLEAPVVEDVSPWQQQLWTGSCGLADTGLAELCDRLENRSGRGNIHRYLPAEHYWPERSFQPAAVLHEKLTARWQVERPRPTWLLPEPERIEVTAPVPDYPPMLFRYKGKLHTIKKADGPERIEREWWLGEGAHRDYYYVEDEEGRRYWIFRSGYYTADNTQQWFMHGFFA